MKNLILLTIFAVNIVCAQLTGVITGQVLDEATQQSLIGVNIQVMGTNLGAASNVEGYFYIADIPVGTQHLKVSMIGYEERIFLNLPVTPARPVDVVAELVISPVEVAAVEVTGKTFSKSSSAIMSTLSMDQSEIRSDPGGVYDIQRIVQSLPSVTSASDQDNEIISRGGAPGENLFIMDEIEIQNPNHFAFEGTGGGPINMINPLFVRKIEFTPGAFSARYGDKASSVMDISLREGSRRHFEWDFDFSMAGAGLNAEGPINSGKGSFLLGTSWSYLDLVVQNIGLTAVPRYNHHQAKVVYDLNSKNRLITNGLIAFDNINIESENDVVGYGAESVDQEGEAYIGGLSLRTLLGKAGYGIATLAFTKQRVFNWVYNGTDHANPWFTRENVISEMHLKDNWFLQSKLGEFNTGFTLKRISYNYDEWAKRDTSYLYNTSQWDGEKWNFSDGIDTPPVTGIRQIRPEWNLEQNDHFWKFAYHLQYAIHIASRLRLTTGIRTDYFSANKEWTFSPRFNLQYDFNRTTKMHFAYGRHYQYPAYFIMLQHKLNENLKAKNTNQFVFGVEHFFDKDLRGSVEVYHKKYNDIYTNYYWTNPKEEYPDTLSHGGQWLNEGVAKSYGVELFLQKKLSRNWHGILSYAWSHSEAKDVRNLFGSSGGGSGEVALNSSWYNWDYDMRHRLTLIGGWKKKFYQEDWYNNIKEKLWFKLLGPLNPLADEVELSFRYAYNSGRPYTEKIYIPEIFNWGISDNTEWNAERYPEYQRLDIMILHRNHFEKLNLVFYIDIMNVFNTNNIWDWSYNKDGTKEEVWQYKTFPVGGITIEF